MKILLRSLLVLTLLLPFGCSSDDDPVIPPPPDPTCTITPANLNFGQVAVSKTNDMMFTITNVSSDSVFGTVSESCADFSITSGGGAYALAPAEIHMVTVRFAPTSTGVKNCSVGTGNSECGSVGLTGEGIVLSATVTSVLDNTLYEDAGGEISNGIGQWMFTGVTKGNTGGNPDPPEIRRAVFAFDIAASGIPAGSTIDSVLLTLHLDLPPNGLNGTRWQYLHQVTRAWGEGASQPLNPNEGGGAQAETGDATWLHSFYNTQMWTSPGGDFVTSVSDSVRVGDVNGDFTWGTTARMVSDVQLWLDTPASNNGWMLIGDESTNQTAKRFATRQRTVAAERPSLLVYYTTP